MADAIMEEHPLNEMTHVKPLLNFPTPQDEIDWLCAWADVIPEGSSLYQLITPNLIKWFSTRVRVGFSADLWGTMKAFSRDRHQIVTKLAKVTTGQEDTFCQACQNAEAHATQLSELADAWQQRADKLGQLNECLSDEVVDLKAKLYDYLMADLAERNGEDA